MDESKTDEAAALPRGSTASPRWIGAPSIALAHQLNRQCVDLLCELASNSTFQQLPQFVLRNRDLWRLLEPQARKRIASFPFVIVDLRFKDAESWRLASAESMMIPADGSLYSDVPLNFFEDLTLETLLFARQAAREEANVAKAMFAMTPVVATLISSLTVSQVRAIASGNASQLRVRWGNAAEFWSDLLIACRAEDESAIAELRRQGMLLFCGELVPLTLQLGNAENGQ